MNLVMSSVVLAATFTSIDLWLVGFAIVLLAVTAFFAMAETALNRMTESKAHSIEHAGGWGSKRVVALVSHPGEYLNVVMLLMIACQLVQATLVGILAYSMFDTWGVVLAIAVDVVLTGAVLAGGSKLVHQIFGVYEAYTTALSKAAQAKSVASSS